MRPGPSASAVGGRGRAARPGSARRPTAQTARRRTAQQGRQQAASTTRACSGVSPASARRASHTPHEVAAARVSTSWRRSAGAAASISGANAASTSWRRKAAALGDGVAQLGGERAVDRGRPAERGHGLEQDGPVVRERVDAVGERPRRVGGHDEDREPLDHPLDDRGVERRQVVEVLEDRPDRHPGPLGDARRGGRTSPSSTRATRGFDDGVAGAGPGGPATARRWARRILALDLQVTRARLGATGEPWCSTMRQRPVDPPEDVDRGHRGPDLLADQVLVDRHPGRLARDPGPARR